MRRLTYSLLATAALGTVAVAAHAQDENRYVQTNFVANKTKYGAAVTDKRFVNAWGIATRPAGAGGHFWVGATAISYQYVGDVHASSDGKLHMLHQDSYKEMNAPVGGKDNVITGITFLDAKGNFVITQNVAGVEPITAPAKFIFASDGGIISAWTERKKPDGTFDRSPDSLAVIDRSKDGAQFFGVASNAAYDRLYAANFGEKPGIQVYGGDFKPLDIKFDQPFDDNKNGQVDPGEYAPFNVMAFNGHIFVTYAKTQPCPEEEIAKGSCKKGELFVGEEDTSKPGQGRLAEFSEDGKLVAVWKDGGHLSAPWGLAFAPSNFGALSGTLLVANFGDGTIAAFDAKSHEFKDVLRNKDGKPAKIDKIWGLIFGNGASLGDSNALYFTAGPDDEKDGLFGSLRVAK